MVCDTLWLQKRCFDPPLLRVNRESREIALRRRSRCFESWIDWEKDIIFIGDRVGQLHNTGFLHALEKQNCREKLKYLAIDANCWEASLGYSCSRNIECSPPAMISRLPQLQRLVFSQTAGAWRDGNETKPHHPSYTINRYREPDPGDEALIESLVESQAESFHKFLSRNQYDIETDFWDPLPKTKDVWRCDVGGVMGLGSYKPVKGLEEERRYGLNGNCGIALIKFDKIEGGYWYEANDRDEISFLKDWAQEEFSKLKSTPRNKSPGDPDYTTWTPPKMDFAIIRRTAPSCFTDDWEGLERDWMRYGEASWARDFTTSYETRDKSKDYPAGQHFDTYAKLYDQSDLRLIESG